RGRFRPRRASRIAETAAGRAAAAEGRTGAGPGSAAEVGRRPGGRDQSEARRGAGRGSAADAGERERETLRRAALDEASESRRDGRERLARQLLPTRGRGRGRAVEVRTASLHESGNRAAIVHADPLRPVEARTGVPRGARGRDAT